MQVALAKMLGKPRQGDERRSDIAWALEAITLRRGAAPQAVVDVLRAALGDPESQVRVFATRALAVIPGDPRSSGRQAGK